MPSSASVMRFKAYSKISTVSEYKFIRAWPAQRFAHFEFGVPESTNVRIH